MAMNNLGRVAMVHRGDYDPGYAYVPLDCCYHDGSTYFCKEPTTGNAPPSVHTAALYTRVQEPGSGPEAWVQGQSYAKDVEVTHNGGVWLSGVDNNIWEPGAAGVFENIWKRVRDV